MPVNEVRRQTGQLLVGLALLAGVVAWPIVVSSPALGDNHIRWTIRLALAFYAMAAGLMLTLSKDGWRATTARGRLARNLWTLSFVTYAVHVALAMHHYHHWSHAHAVEHTRQVAGIGEGIYASHLFGLWWGLDAAWWWLSPERYAGRSPAIGLALHSYMAFIWFNGTVVYEQGIIRWAGLATFVALAAIWGATANNRRAARAIAPE
jgi:hypothetical protein